MCERGQKQYAQTEHLMSGLHPFSDLDARATMARDGEATEATNNKSTFLLERLSHHEHAREIGWHRQGAGCRDRHHARHRRVSCAVQRARQADRASAAGLMGGACLCEDCGLWSWLCTSRVSQWPDESPPLL